MYKKALIALILIGLVLSACSAARNVSPSTSDQYKNSGGPAPSAPQEAAGGSTGSGSSSSSSGNAYSRTLPEVKRIVLRNASLQLAVDNPAQSMDRITKLAEEFNGYVVSANLSQTHLDSGVDVPQASITLRVPADRLDEALTRIKTETTRPVLSEKVDSQDVTKDYTDLQSRLANLQAAEAQLKEIMQSATKTDDVLSVYNQLTQVREQIEVIQGQIKYYDQSAAYSAISVDLMANAAVQPLTIGTWQPVGVAKDALQALIGTVKFFATAGIWLVLWVLPTLAILAIPFVVLFLIVRSLRRRRIRPAAPPSAPTAAAG